MPASQPLVVYGPASHRYDFGERHPLTPRRFGPGIDLLRAVGATRFDEPREAGDDEIARLHDRPYIATVRMLSSYPDAGEMLGFSSHGDDPPFEGMHEAAAAVAGGSIDAVGRILDGTLEHAFHPGGGLHHAMPGHSSGFCIYNDVALAIARARDAGERVLYVDLDVHHGDGVEAMFRGDAAVMTISFHESGLYLFPGTGFVEECGDPEQRGTAVNVPLEPATSDGSWLAAVELVVPPLAEAFRPTLLVTQHGSDAHLLDPLAHLHLTTAAMGRAAGLMHRIAHEHAGGRWLATGGGGYDVYRVVPRVWALVWLAQAHLAVPEETPAGWRERWADEAAIHGQAPPPERMLDPSEWVPPETWQVAEVNAATARAALDCSLRSLERASGG